MKTPITNKNVASRVRNEMHFEVQRTTRMQVVTPKKGKGSFKRTKIRLSDIQAGEINPQLFFGAQATVLYIFSCTHAGEDVAKTVTKKLF